MLIKVKIKIKVENNKRICCSSLKISNGSIHSHKLTDFSSSINKCIQRYHQTRESGSEIIKRNIILRRYHQTIIYINTTLLQDVKKTFSHFSVAFRSTACKLRASLQKERAPLEEIDGKEKKTA